MALRLTLSHHSFPGGTQTIPTHITVSLVVLRVYLYSSQSLWWNSDYPYTHHSLPRGTQTIPLLITVCLVVLRLSLYSSQSPWWYSYYPLTHHNLAAGPQTIPILITVSRGGPHTIPIHITVSLVVLRLSLYSSQSLWWHSDYSYTHHCLPIGSDNPYTHHSLPGGTQTIPILITVSLVALRLSLYSSQSTWWLRQSLHSSQSPLWYSDYPYTHHSLSGGTQTIPILITVRILVSNQSIPIQITFCLVVLRLTLYASQSLWWYSEYPYNHHSLPKGT